MPDQTTAPAAASTPAADPPPAPEAAPATGTAPLAPGERRIDGTKVARNLASQIAEISHDLAVAHTVIGDLEQEKAQLAAENASLRTELVNVTSGGGTTPRR